MSTREQLTELVEEFDMSLKDSRLSDQEKKEIRHQIKDLDLRKQDKAFLRNQVFKLAKSQFSQHPGRELIHWLERSLKLIEQNSASGELKQRAYFSPGDDCLEVILKQIRNADRLIELAVFTISDDRIKDALIRAHHNGIDIKIVTDYDKQRDAGSDIEEFVNNGIPVKVDTRSEHMHHKFALFDEQILLTGSFNWTRGASVRNHENILETNDVAMIRAYRKEFAKLWNDFEKIV